jgi:excisionase family DNA binding protein
MTGKNSSPLEPAAFTIAEFCEAHRISRSKLYQLFKNGTGPAVIRIGTKVLISREAAASWRRERETPSTILYAEAAPETSSLCLRANPK